MGRRSRREGRWFAAVAAAGLCLTATVWGSRVAGAIATTCPLGATSWVNPAGGAWLTPANWSAGVPTAATPACIDLPGTYTVTLVVAASTPAQSLFLGVPGAAAQPQLSITRGTLAVVGDVAIHGRLNLASAISFSSAVVAGETISVAPTGTVTGGGTGSNGLEGDVIENEGSISVPGGLGLRGPTIANRGSIAVASGRSLSIRGPTSGGTPGLRLESGAVSILGTMIQTNGSIGVLGGTFAGELDITAPATIDFAADTGGRFHFGPPAHVANVNVLANGTIGPTEHLFIGPHAVTVQTSSLRNRGQVTIQSTSSLGRGSSGLETLAGGSFRNSGTLTFTGNGAPGLRGDLENAADGVIVATSESTLRPDPFINRGTVRINSSGGLNVTGLAADRPPIVVLEEGSVDATGGYVQSNGRLEVLGGAITGTLQLVAPVALELDADTGGRFNIGPPAHVTNVFAQVNGTVGSTEHLFISPHAITAQTSSLHNLGLVTVQSTLSPGRAGSLLETLPAGAFRNSGTVMLAGNGNPTIRGDVENALGGSITATSSSSIGANPFVNRGTVHVNTGVSLNLRGVAPGTPSVTFAGGSVEAIGALTQTGGRLEVLGGSVAGQMSLSAPAALELHGDTGGRFNLGPGGGGSISFSQVNGTVGPTEHLFIGPVAITAQVSSLLNRGQMTVQDTLSFGLQGTMLETLPGGAFRNAGTLTLTGNGGPTLRGDLENSAGAVIAPASDSILQPNPMVNRGVIRPALGVAISVGAPTGGPAPIVVTEGGILDLTNGTYQQTGGRFEWNDGTVLGTRSSTFNAVRFSGFGVWNRALALPAGRLVPGPVPRRIAISGDYSPNATTVTELVLGGDDPGSGYSRIDVGTAARLAGTLSVGLVDGFVPRPCQAFDVVTWTSRFGTFVNTGPIDVGSGMSLRQLYTPTGLVLIAYRTGSSLNVHPTAVEVAEGGAADTYQLCRANAPTGTETITISPDSQVSTDLATVQFTAANWPVPQTVTVSAVDDTLFELSPHEGRIRHTSSTGAIVDTVIAAITDNGDEPSTDLTVEAAGPYSAPEGGTVGVSATESGAALGATYIWDLDDNGTFETPGQTATFDGASLDGPSSHTVHVRVTDGAGRDAFDSATINVTNVAPTAVLSATGPVDEGDTFELTLAGPFDPSAADTTAGFEYAFDCGDGVGFGAFGAAATASCATADDGLLSAGGKIRDKDGGESEYLVVVTVANVPPTADFSAPSPVEEGSPILAFSDASDPSSADTAAGFEYAFDCGDGAGFGPWQGSPSGGCPTVDDGVRTVQGRIRDKDGGQNEYSAEVTITNLAPTATFGASSPVDEGSPIALSLTDPFDPSSADTLAGFEYAFDCGGGYSAWGTEATATCPTADDGPHTVSGQIRDKDGGLTEYISIATVLNVAPTATFVASSSVDEGSPVALSLSDPVDPSSADTTAGFEYAFDCGAGFGPYGSSPTASCPTTDDGLQAVGGRIRDKDDGFSEYSAEVTVANVVPAADFSAPGAAEGSPIELSLTDEFDPSSADTAAGFEYAFDCGGGFGPYGSLPTASCPTSDNGSRTVGGRIRDKDGGESEYTAEVAIANVAPTATFAAPAIVDEGSSIELALTGPSDPSSDDSDAGFQYAFDCGDGAGFGPAGAASTATCPTSDGGSRTVRGRVEDKDGGATGYSLVVAVANVAPTVTVVEPAAGASFDVGESVAARATFSDAGTADTHTCSIGWGDSASSVGTVAAGACSGSHSYAGVGPFTITFTITDDDTGAGTDDVAITVVGGQEAFFLLLDRDAIDTKRPPNHFEKEDINDKIARVGQRAELPWFAARPGQETVLYSGAVGDEGWFALTELPDAWTLADFLDGTVDKHLLKDVPGVTPLRAAGLRMLEGQAICAVVWDQDIKVKYDPLEGKLKGKTLGTVAFTVVGVTARAGDSLPAVRIRILKAVDVCVPSIGLFESAPDPRSPSDPR